MNLKEHLVKENYPGWAVVGTCSSPSEFVIDLAGKTMKITFIGYLKLVVLNGEHKVKCKSPELVEILENVRQKTSI